MSAHFSDIFKQIRCNDFLRKTENKGKQSQITLEVTDLLLFRRRIFKGVRNAWIEGSQKVNEDGRSEREG